MSLPLVVYSAPPKIGSISQLVGSVPSKVEIIGGKEDLSSFRCFSITRILSLCGEKYSLSGKK